MRVARRRGAGSSAVLSNPKTKVLRQKIPPVALQSPSPGCVSDEGSGCIRPAGRSGAGGYLTDVNGA